jgi:hypothetical protein
MQRLTRTKGEYEASLVYEKSGIAYRMVRTLTIYVIWNT